MTQNAFLWDGYISVFRPKCLFQLQKNKKHEELPSMCVLLEEESSFCLELSTHPVSEIVPVCLNPRLLVLITLL